MKSILLFTILSLILLLAGCEKDSFDYRSKYLGDYHFTLRDYSDIMGHIKDTTYYADGTIGNGQDSHSIAVNIQGIESVQLYLFEDGSVSGNSYDYYRIRGEFESGNTLKYSSTWWALPGTGSLTVTGNRK